MTVTDPTDSHYRLSFVVSAGHAEYWVDPLDGLSIWSEWDPSQHEEEVDEMGEDELVEIFERTFDRYPPVEDLSWNHIVHWSGPRSTVIAGLTRLLGMLQIPPSGDDDVIDYWPSGARYAQAIAGHLGEIWTDMTNGILREVAHLLGDNENEILDRLGLKDPGLAT